MVTVTILDTLAQGLALTTNDFSSLNLDAYGPEDPQVTTTPVKLLNATADRTKTPQDSAPLHQSVDEPGCES